MRPLYLQHKNDKYLMQRRVDGNYETTLPSTRVPKIGVRPPKKKKFTYEQLIAKGYTQYEIH